jgi:threonine/homoserine/homoserine lactone efflux protein
VFDVLSLVSLSFLAALSGAVVPGPVFVIVVSESLKKGKKAGPLVVLGHLAIEAIIILIVFLGLDALLRLREATVLVSYIGGSTLILMGFYLIRTAKNFRADVVSTSNPRFASHGLIASGFLSSISNPHFFLWWLTPGIPTMTYSLAVAGAVGFLAFLIGHAAGDLLWFSLMSYSIDKGRSFLNQMAIRIILFGSAIFLMIFGLYLILSANVT